MLGFWKQLLIEEASDCWVDAYICACGGKLTLIKAVGTNSTSAQATSLFIFLLNRSRRLLLSKQYDKCVKAELTKGN